ncbi:hypothetical protein P691DRAFT_689348 [Macrolepiota fuliginosa MF-IS2]|uniref:Uncharacterized protein n=1 Tax=Macrolepiota fuliginosa MF-IS2 TaxID=1400762 RepID=A0A9P5WWA2_9AGAR|nr:hypothetical protein P691DRAFT_689348 [Macrolepiota fuliginosa MF-IS2]
MSFERKSKHSSVSVLVIFKSVTWWSSFKCKITLPLWSQENSTTFWMSLLFVEDRMFTLITALNILEEQIVEELQRLSILAHQSRS